jgi:hypothetical protein
VGLLVKHEFSVTTGASSASVCINSEHLFRHGVSCNEARSGRRRCDTRSEKQTGEFVLTSRFTSENSGFFIAT